MNDQVLAEPGSIRACFNAGIIGGAPAHLMASAASRCPPNATPTR
jgi:hypothetical protein